jgi:hypothetical protein
VSQIPTPPGAQVWRAALTTALENALNFALTARLAFYENWRYRAGKAVREWFAQTGRVA